MKSKIKSKKAAPAPVPKAAPAPAPKAVGITPRAKSFDSELTYLQVGDIVDLGPGLGGEHLVWKCNDCRASCIPLSKRNMQVKGQEIESAGLKPIGISPNSEVPILRRLGKSGMIEFLENRQKQNSENNMKDKNKAAKKEASTEPKLGKLGGFHGFAITACIRAMAVAGWEYWEIRQVFDKEKIDVADNTIRIQLSAGRKGKGGAPAELTKKFLASIRPDPEDKPAATRKAAADKPTKSTKATKAVKAAKKAKDEEEDEEDEAPAKPVKKSKKPVVEDEDEDEDEAPESDEDGEDGDE